MGLLTVHDQQNDLAAPYDSVSETALGPVFTGERCYELSECFIRYFNKRRDELGTAETEQIEEEFRILQQSLSLHQCSCGNVCLSEEKMEATNPYDISRKLPSEPLPVYLCPECGGSETCARCGGPRVETYLDGGSCCHNCRSENPHLEEERKRIHAGGILTTDD